VVPDLSSEAEDTLIGTRLGSYDITRKIGHGGMGVVYLARDNRLDRPVAIKMLAPRYTSNPQFRERLKREARAAAKLSHPGIATVYSLEEVGDALYIVSEYVNGPTLFKLIENGPVPVPRLLDIAIQISKALAAAHEQGIVHRDLKPENVIGPNRPVKILDFGLARFELNRDLGGEARLTRSGVFLGTPAHASPEQLLGSEIDRRTDIFSFRVLLAGVGYWCASFRRCRLYVHDRAHPGSQVPDLTKVNRKSPRDWMALFIAA
jgi:serine/threonine protein kinase